MSEDLPDSPIPYDEIVQEALRAVVGRVLGEVQQTGGLPGAHHFYITFKTQAPGVDIPQHLVERFPDEMTIVMENQYWDLVVGDDKFSITLSFGGAPETLVIPYAAITAFVDPSVKFGLQFDANTDDALEAPPQPREEAISPVDGPAPDGEKVSAELSTDDGQVVALDNFRKK